MIDSADKDDERKRRKKRTSKKWNKLLQRCERASKVFNNNRVPVIETKWHINIQDAHDCLSTYAEEELTEIKLAILENEQSYIQELDILCLQAKEVLRWHHSLPRFNRQCITKNLQKLKSNALTIEKTVTSVQHNDMQALLEAMEGTLNEKFVSYLIIYCENIGELRGLFKQKMRKDSEFCRLLFSSYFQIERSLLPIHRVSKLQSLIKEVLEMLTPISHLGNSGLYNQAVLLEAKLSEIVTKCHEITHSILGSNYMNNILQALFPFDLKLPSNFKTPEITRKNVKDGNLKVLIDNEKFIEKSRSNGLKSFTDEVLTAPLFKANIFCKGSRENLNTQNQCDDVNLRLKQSLQPATSTESIFYDSESSEILQAIELSALKLQLKTEDEAEKDKENEEDIMERVQRRRRTISERETRCSQKCAEILQEEAVQNFGQNAKIPGGNYCNDGFGSQNVEMQKMQNFEGSRCCDDLGTTDHFYQNVEGSGTTQDFCRNAECFQGVTNWKCSGSTQSSGDNAGSSAGINSWTCSGATLNFDRNAASSPAINNWNGSGSTQSSSSNSWRRCWNHSMFSRRSPAPRPLSWTGASESAFELIEMNELSASAPGILCHESGSRPIGEELLKMLETSFGCKAIEQRCGQLFETEPINSRVLPDDGQRVGDSSIFYDLPQTSPADSNSSLCESREHSINEEQTKGKRMKRVSEVLQRTLWEETDRVIQANILGNMTKADIALQESKFEILTSELSYLNSLNVLVTVFMNCKELSSILSKSDEEGLFNHIMKVKKASELFLYDLAGQWEDDIFLSGIYCEIEKHSRTSLKVYVDYCSNQVNLHRTLQRLLLEDEEFVELINNLQQSSECFGNSLNSFLMLPMQRVTRLPLLLQTIERRLPADSDEKKECQLTLDSLHKLVHECNEAVRDAENESCIEDRYGHKKKLSLNALEPLTPKPSHRKWSLFNIRELS